MTYVLYKIGKGASGDSVTRVMDNENIDRLREDANHFFADPDNLIGRKNEQLTIPAGQLQSNVVTTIAGDKEYHRFVEIREIGKAK